MTIKAQHRALLAALAVIFLMVFGIVQRANQVDYESRARNLMLSQVIREVFDFSITTNDYLLNPSDRALGQMKLRLDSLSEFLGGASLGNGERQQLMVDMRQSLEQGRQVFDQIKNNHDAFHAQYHVDISKQIDPYVHQQIEDLSVSLSIHAMALVTSATRLQKASAESDLRMARNYDRLVISGLAVAFILVALAVAVFSRRFVHAISALEQGTARIAMGDMSEMIPVSGSDELTDLIRHVNDMAKSLQASYQALEAEIEERQRKETDLLESQQQLRRDEENIKRLNLALNEQVLKLEEANRELEAFSYSVSHDLRAPLRHLTGFVELLNSMDANGLNEQSRHYLEVISDASRKMGCLIDDLLAFARMGRGESTRSAVDLNQLTLEVAQELTTDLPPERTIQWRIGELPVIVGDRALLRLALANLIGNALKFTRRCDSPLIEVGCLPPEKGHATFFVRDNGAGFDMKFVDKLFGLFQRLHSDADYEGTGVGLASVRRVIGRHGGRTWAEGVLGQGATIYFTLPVVKET